MVDVIGEGDAWVENRDGQAWVQGDRVSWWGIKMTRAICELVNPAFNEVFYGTFKKGETQIKAK